MLVPCKWIMKIIKDVAKNGHNNSKISSSRALWLICSCKSAAKGERVINRAEDCSRRQAALSLHVSGYLGSTLSPALPACCCQWRNRHSLSTPQQSQLSSWSYGSSPLTIWLLPSIGSVWGSKRAFDRALLPGAEFKARKEGLGVARWSRVSTAEFLGEWGKSS